MHTISAKALREFWMAHADAQPALRAWLRLVESARWSSPAEMKALFPTADIVGQLTVFNVGGNKYRLVAMIKYDWHVVYIRAVLTHAEYDRGHWKNDEFNR
jgi:mRNA interferase HigB